MKIKSVKICKSNIPIPVYDATSPVYHNLVLENGCVVHNTAKQARDKEYQAVLALRGKIQNAFRTTPEKLFTNEEIQNICMAIGFELDAKNPIEKLRVGRIIALSDPDVDGPLHPDTKIITVDGENPTIKQLTEEFKQGKPPRAVYSQDMDGNLVTGTAFMPKLAVKELESYNIYFNDGTAINCTGNHAWKVKDINLNSFMYSGIPYVKTKYLKRGNFIVALNNLNKTLSHLIIEEIKLITHKYYQPYYCLTVPEYGNFFVDTGEGNGVLSKNSHIENLILSFFQKVFPDTFKNGHVYTCNTPLFYCQRPNGDKIFGVSYDDVKNKMDKKGYKLPPEGVQRIKGWGEVEADTLFDLAFNKKTRKLTRMLPAIGKDAKKFVDLVSSDTSARQELLGV